MKNFSIRQPTLNDAARLAGLHKINFEKPWSEQDFKQFLSDGCNGWIALINDADAGFLLIQQSGDDGEILSIGVNPDYRNQGIAFALISLAANQLTDQMQSLFLDVGADNHSAIHLYEKLSFTVINRRMNYYQTKSGLQDALMMQKNLR